MKHRFIHKFVLVTMIFGSMYGLLHFMNRNMANDMPQLLATQGAKVVDAYGVSALNTQPTDLANNPVPFVIVYDKNSKPVAGTGYLGKKLAQMPVGVVNHATAGKPHAVTWQPQKGVRIASVTAKAKDYYVLGGQSLAVTENRMTRMLLLTLAGYLATLAALAVTAFMSRRYWQPYHNQCACMHGGTCTCQNGQCTCKIPGESTPKTAVKSLQKLKSVKAVPTVKKTKK